MIRLSRMGAIIRCGAYLASAMVVAFGCAQNGIGNGGLGGAQAGAGGASTGAAGALGGGGGSEACPLTQPVVGTPCTGTPHCGYGTALCCGVAMTDMLAECGRGSWILVPNDTICRLGLACPGGTTSGQGGVAGSSGGGGAGGAGGQGCPATPIPEGFSCHPGDPGLGCTYNPATCCGITYPTLQLGCQEDSVVQETVENPCTASAGYVCPTADGGAGGASGITTCPVTAPTPNGSFPASCAAALVCNYGSRICCGKTVPEETFSCSAGGVLGYAVVDCPSCSDASTDAPSGAAGAGGASGTAGAGGAFTF